MAKHHMKHREAGGLVEDKKPKIDYRTPKGDKEEEEGESTKEGFKHGGAMHKHKKRAHGGHVEGHKPHERLDKRARGGPTKGGHSPFSSAESVKGRPGGKYDGEPDKETD